MNILVIGQNDLGDTKLMRIDGHYDVKADIARLQFKGYDPATAVPEKTDYGFRELDIGNRQVVGLDYWQASRNLPTELLAMLSAPGSSPEDHHPTSVTDSRIAQHRIEMNTTDQT